MALTWGQLSGVFEGLGMRELDILAREADSLRKARRAAIDQIMQARDYLGDALDNLSEIEARLNAIETAAEVAAKGR